MKQNLNELMGKQADTLNKTALFQRRHRGPAGMKVLTSLSPGKCKQNHNKMITSHLLECLSSKYKRTSVGKGVERGTPVTLQGCKLVQPLWKTAKKFLNN